MIRRVLWFLAASIVSGGAAVLFLRPDVFHQVFGWLLGHPLTPLSGAMALWAIIALLGEKNLRKATWIESLAILLLFHVEFMNLFRSVLYSLVRIWRML